ncbi:hypothetical protein [Ramlibacter pallidus]|uniref:Uncharacterized protein n=1 Tax=Ramlibacter pallidus TaxID=2780087 RepID=A0ABR9S045_9BURK|nr:hypothetical protein [Ramlibacter pallidus]MBE7366896.1 hypothetical protein [Ramlibacter pallidus]
MPSPSADDQEGLPPPGSRWGSGAQSVLPYLTKSLQAKPATAPEPRERPREGNPVFSNWPPRQA